MSQDPKKRNKDIVEQSKDNEDPAAEPIEVSGEQEQAGAGAADSRYFNDFSKNNKSVLIGDISSLSF